MKKTIILFIMVISFLSFNSKVYSENDTTIIKTQIEKIILQPNSLSTYYEKNNYNYSLNFLSKKMRDSQYVEKINSLILNNFNHDTTKITFRVLTNDEFIMKLIHNSTEITNINESSVFSIVAIKADFGMRFIFYKSSDLFYLIHINEFPELLYQLDDKFNIILQFPNQILDLKKNFPDFCDENYLSDNMKNSLYIDELINNIEKLCQDDCTDLILFQKKEDTIQEAKINLKMKNSIENQIKIIGYGFFVEQEKYYGDISFTFYKICKKIYLNNIHCSVNIKEE